MMFDPMPLMRPDVDVIPTRQDEETIYVLYDKSGLSDAQLGVSATVVFVASKLDGRHAILNIKEAFEEEIGSLLEVETITKILNAFDEALFLQGERLERVLNEQREVFYTSKIRQPTSVGEAYNAEPEVLANELQAMIAAAPPVEEPGADSETSAPRGIIIPHIDYSRGAAGYGQAYRELAKRTPPRVVIILGIAHQPIHNRYAVCTKDFAVPGGVVRHASAETAFLLDHCRSGADFSADQFVHRGEHSIELQAVWLRHIWGDAVEIVPVLAGSLGDFTEVEDASVGAAADDPQLGVFSEALQKLMARGAGEVMVLASVDLAHVGQRFGDTRELAGDFLREVEAADRHYLQAVASGAGAGERGLESIREQADQYHVCGVAGIYALNAALPEVPGRLLGYHQAATPEMQQAVTFASMIFE